MPDSDPAQTLRARTREHLRGEVAAVALTLFVERGFDGVTAQEIARAAGISPRSFFRYFPTKEDAAMAGLEASATRVASALAARPADESVWDSLMHAFAVLIEAPGTEGLDPLEVSRLFVQTPALRARRFEKHQGWGDALLPLLEDRLPATDAPVPREVVGASILAAALSLLDTSTEIWVRHEGTVPAAAILHGAFGAVAAGVVLPST